VYDYQLLVVIYICPWVNLRFGYGRFTQVAMFRDMIKIINIMMNVGCQ